VFFTSISEPITFKMKPGLYHEQKCSQLLTKDENESVLQLLGPKCQVNYFLLSIIDRIFTIIIQY